MTEHRAGVRFRMELPIRLRWKSRGGSYREAQGKTENIGANGLFVAVPVRPREKTPIRVTVALPAGVGKVPLELLCQGRVVRLSQPGEMPGIGAIIDDYQFRPAAQHV